MSSPIVSKKRSAENDLIPATVLCSANDSDAKKSKVETDINTSILLSLTERTDNPGAKRVRFSESSIKPVLHPMPYISSPPMMSLPSPQVSYVMEEYHVDQTIVSNLIHLMREEEISSVRRSCLYIRLIEYLIEHPYLLRSMTLRRNLMIDIQYHEALMEKNRTLFENTMRDYNGAHEFSKNCNKIIMYNRLSEAMKKLKPILESI